MIIVSDDINTCSQLLYYQNYWKGNGVLVKFQKSIGIVCTSKKDQDVLVWLFDDMKLNFWVIDPSTYGINFVGLLEDSDLKLFWIEHETEWFLLQCKYPDITRVY